jgi:signal transduction histidine kinase
MPSNADDPIPGVNPVLKRFHGLRISQKLMLISFFFLIPDSVLLMLFLVSINANIHFAQWERYGSEYQRPLEQLLEDLPSHRLLARGGQPTSQDGAALVVLQRRLDQAFVDLRAIDSRLGESLQFTDEGLAKRSRAHYRVGTLAREWSELKAQLPALSAPEREARHVHLLADVRMMIKHAGDTSNLILDPDLDSYYLMDVTLLALPQMQDRLAAVLANDTALAPGHLMSPRERSQLAVAAALLREIDLDRVVTSTRTALNEDQNFYGRSESLQRNIPPLLAEFANAADTFIAAIAALDETDHSAETLDRFRAAGELARRASFTLWRAADQELDVLLAHRIQYYRARRASSLILTAFAITAAVGFVTFITRSISGPLKKQAAALQESNRTLQTEMQERQRVEAALIEASHEAGMAEVATGVLHNVGNVLNSVNLGAAGVRERLASSRLTHLRKAIDLLEQHQDDLPAFLTADLRGKALPPFLVRITAHLEGENRQLCTDMGVLADHIDHIKQIVSMQQSYARTLGLMETVPLQALIEDAIRLNADSFTRHRVLIDRAFAIDPTVIGDRHKVLQILVNLLRNAQQAIGEADPAERCVTVRLGSKGPDRVFISVSDTGTGIGADDMAKIFRLGFTTKKNGHGFGLHTSALAARQMKGEILVHSDGPRRGATFTLELPRTLSA